MTNWLSSGIAQPQGYPDTRPQSNSVNIQQPLANSMPLSESADVVAPQQLDSGLPLEGDASGKQAQGAALDWEQQTGMPWGLRAGNHGHAGGLPGAERSGAPSTLGPSNSTGPNQNDHTSQSHLWQSAPSPSQARPTPAQVCDHPVSASRNPSKHGLLASTLTSTLDICCSFLSLVIAKPSGNSLEQ